MSSRDWEDELLQELLNDVRGAAKYCAQRVSRVRSQAETNFVRTISLVFGSAISKVARAISSDGFNEVACTRQQALLSKHPQSPLEHGLTFNSPMPTYYHTAFVYKIRKTACEHALKNYRAYLHVARQGLLLRI